MEGVCPSLSVARLRPCPEPTASPAASPAAWPLSCGKSKRVQDRASAYISLSESQAQEGPVSKEMGVGERFSPHLPVAVWVFSVLGGRSGRVWLVCVHVHM